MQREKIFLQDTTPGDSSAFGAKVTLDLTEVSTGSVTQNMDLQPMVMSLFAEVAVKWTLNAVSTGAHIMKGKVFNNIMIDLKPRSVLLVWPYGAPLAYSSIHPSYHSSYQSE